MSDFKYKKDEETVEDKFEKKQPVPRKTLKKYKIVLISENYVIVKVDGFNRFIDGKFSNKKVGDEIEVEI